MLPEGCRCSRGYDFIQVYKFYYFCTYLFTVVVFSQLYQDLKEREAEIRLIIL